MEMTDALKIHVEDRLEKLRSHFDRDMDANVVLSVEKHRHIAEISIHANTQRFQGKESSQDMYKSIDAVIDKLDTQIRRSKKTQRHDSLKHQEAAELETDVEELEEEATAPKHDIVHKKLPMTHLSVAEAAEQLNLSKDAFLVFSNIETQQVNVIYARKDGKYAVIEPEY